MRKTLTWLLCAVTTVILVRHGEKEASTGNNPPLSAAGIARSNELARVLADTPIDAILTTPYKRTEGTVAPLAAAKKIEPASTAAGKSYARDVANLIRTKYAGKTVVVAGHSNTTPDLAKALGVNDPPAIPDSRYDDMFIITIPEGGQPSLLKLRYGAPAR